MSDSLADLVEQAQRGDAQAYAMLYEQFEPLVRRFLYVRLDGSRETAEDLTSVVFLKVWQNLSLYVDRGLPFQGWLFRIARNCLIDYLRRQPRYSVDALDLAANVADRTSNEDFGQVIDQHILETALAQLGADQRQIVQLRFLEGLSAVETGLLTGRSTAAVKKLQARALVNLHRLLLPAKVRITGSAKPRHIQVAA